MKKQPLFFFALFCTCFIPVLSYGQVTVAPFESSREQFLDQNGKIVASGCLFTYQAGTTTPLATYSDLGVTLNANPVILDSTGSATIYMQLASYKLVLKTFGGTNCATGSTLWTQDNVNPATALTSFPGIVDTGAFTMQQSTAATSGANQSSNNFQIQGNYWTGSASATDQWQLQDVLGTGSNPTSTLTFSHSGSSGAVSVSFPSAALSGISSATITGALTAGTTTTSSIDNYLFIDGITYPKTVAGVNSAIATLPSGGTIYLPCGDITVTTTSVALATSQRIILQGCGGGPNGTGATRLVASGSAIPLTVTGSFGVRLKDFTICGTTGNTAAVGLDIDQNAADVTLDHVYVAPCSSSPVAFSTADYRVGSTTSGSPCTDIKFYDSVAQGSSGVGFLLLRGNSIRQVNTKAYDNSTANTQVGDSTHAVVDYEVFAGENEPNTTAASGTIINNCQSCEMHEYTENGLGSFAYDIPSTATKAEGISIYGRFFTNSSEPGGQATSAVRVALSSATVNLYSPTFIGFPNSSNLVTNTTSQRITIYSPHSDNASLSLLSSATHASYIDFEAAGSNVGSLFISPLQIGTGPAITSSGVGGVMGATSGTQRFFAGCSGTATASSTVYLTWAGGTCTTTTNPLQVPTTSAGTAKNLRVRCATGGTNASSGVFTLLQNASGSVLTCTTGTGTTCNDTTHTVSLAAGDTLLVQFTTQTAETLANCAASFEVQ